MKEKTVLLSSVLLASVLLVACSICVIALVPEPAVQEYQPSTWPLLFQSVEEFEAAESKARSGETAYYYIPADLPDHMKFYQISKVEGAYIAVTYSVETSGIDTTGLSSYGIERISSLICQFDPYEDGSVPLTSFSNMGFKPIDYQGRTIYYFEDRDSLSSDNRLVGYSIAFLQDEHCIYMHLPAIDTFENMMQYADVVKVTID